MKVDLNLPWVVVDDGANIVDSDGCLAVCSLSVDEAPLVVRAVNNHDALVAMVRRLIECRGDDGIARATALDARDLLASIDQ